jgi:uncharacterized membrane protein HdeD (DUF308 family)
MRPLFVVGLLLIAVGIAAFSYQGVVWVRGREQIAKIGPIEIERERAYAIPLAPIIGGVAIAAGIGAMVMSLRRADGKGSG